MRVKRTILNTIAGWGTQLIKIVGGFIVRTFFIASLSKEYLGLDSLFATILQLLSFVELGLGAAVFTSLYEPIEKKNIRNKQLLFFFQGNSFGLLRDS